jgi:hypothetical protein
VACPAPLLAGLDRFDSSIHGDLPDRRQTGGSLARGYQGQNGYGDRDGTNESSNAGEVRSVPRPAAARAAFPAFVAPQPSRSLIFHDERV